jgi:hypothetical protein
MTPFRIFIGYDERESEAYHVLCSSILRRSSIPVSITPLVRSQLTRIHARPRGEKESTDFSITRFLVPYLCGYEGHALFMDCDMLLRADLIGLLPFAMGDRYAVSVCQHDYQTKAGIKFLGQSNVAYPRKNWSSLMVFNASQCTALTPEYVNTASALELHRFNWTTDGKIGAIPLAWNWLVGEYDHNPKAKIAHFTLGTPCFSEYAVCDYADEWRDERDRMLHAAQIQVA